MVAAAVIVHLAADGTKFIDQTQCNITVQLVDTKDGFHSLGENSYSIFKLHPTSCTSDATLSY